MRAGTNLFIENTIQTSVVNRISKQIKKQKIENQKSRKRLATMKLKKQDGTVYMLFPSLEESFVAYLPSPPQTLLCFEGKRTDRKLFYSSLSVF